MLHLLNEAVADDKTTLGGASEVQKESFQLDVLNQTIHEPC